MGIRQRARYGGQITPHNSSKDFTSPRVAGGGGIYPNEPAGYTRYWENDFDHLPHSPPGVYGAAAGTDWWDEDDAGAVSSVVDATTPFGNDKAMRWAFPGPNPGPAQPSGSAPINVNVNSLTGGERHEQYICQVLKIEGTDFENQSTGCKMGYFGYAEDQDGVFNQCIIMFFNDSGGVQAIEGPKLQLGFIQQGVTTEENYIYGNLNGGAAPIFQIGQFVVIEWVMKMNTMTTNTTGPNAGPNVADGELHMWLDGVKYHEHFDVVWRGVDITNPSDPAPAILNKGFQGWKVDPVWGGIGGTKTRDDFWRIAHIYGSGIAF